MKSLPSIDLRSVVGKAGRFKKRTVVVSLLAMVLLTAGIWVAYAQRELPRKESKLTFARIQFNYFMNYGGRGGGRMMGPIGASNGPPWSHDFPRGEENIMKIVSEVTRIEVNPGGHIINFGSDECFKYPVAYLCEVGYLNLSAQEAQNMREYLLRGGFLIVDDFRGQYEWSNFAEQIRMVFPERQFEELPRNHPIFTCFYDLTNVYLQPPYGRGYPAYYGMKDDNGRLMMVVDYNNDISEYWEWSADPFFKMDETNQAFKYGVNYFMYALTH